MDDNELRKALLAVEEPMKAGDQPEDAMAPDLHALFIETPLYSPSKATDRDFLAKIRAGNLQIDSYCLGCGQDSLFKTMRSVGAGSGRTTPRNYNWMRQAGFVSVDLICQRDSSHVYNFRFHYDGESLIKYGQLRQLYT